MTLRLRLLAALMLTASGCTQAPHAIVLPTTAAIRAPLKLAAAHVAQSVAIGHQEQTIAADAVGKGIVAGSEEARELSSLIVSDTGEKKAAQDQLAHSLYQAGEMDREQARKQAQIDALATHDAVQTARVGVLTRSRLHWQETVLILFVADFFAGNVIQMALRGAASFVCRAFFAFGRHLIAFWPVLLACV